MVKLTKTELAVGDLYYRQGLRPREIAQRLGISINTVYKALSKYRSQLRDNLNINGQAESPLGGKEDYVQPQGGQASITLVNLSFTVNTTQPIQPSVVNLSEVNELLGSLSRDIKLLKDDYSRIIDALMELKKLVSSMAVVNCGGYVDSRVSGDGRDLNLPSFVRDNVWVDIIRSKEGGRSMLTSAKSS
ncbi:MAG: helix-turn-helix domain-containing protein [Caldivirga sp.]